MGLMLKPPLGAETCGGFVYRLEARLPPAEIKRFIPFDELYARIVGLCFQNTELYQPLLDYVTERYCKGRPPVTPAVVEQLRIKKHIRRPR